jgi:Ca2+-transporting ATPase
LVATVICSIRPVLYPEQNDRGSGLCQSYNAYGGRLLPTLRPTKRKKAFDSVLCRCLYEKNEDGKFIFSGDPTETALLDFGVLYGLYKDDMEKASHRVAEIPFDSERKRMTTVNRMADRGTSVNVKGGLDEVLSVCDKIVIEGVIKPLTSGDVEKIRYANETMANSALRVLQWHSKHLRRSLSR